MTLEQYAYLAEILGVVLVIASLVYVAQQLRQNTNMMRANAASEWLQRNFDIAASVIDNQEFAEIWVKGGLEFESLDRVEKQRMLLFERRAFGLWHELYSLHKQNLLPDSTWHEYAWVIRNLGNRQSKREAWKVFKDAYEKPFQEFVESQFAVADSAPRASFGTLQPPI
jgi:hypothetical protein